MVILALMGKGVSLRESNNHGAEITMSLTWQIMIQSPARDGTGVAESHSRTIVLLKTFTEDMSRRITQPLE